jgi:hypothetical protein
MKIVECITLIAPDASRGKVASEHAGDVRFARAGEDR